jgi:Protein of unknown function (DUF3179)
VEVGGVARAYPLRVLVWHEVVNAASAGGHCGQFLRAHGLDARLRPARRRARAPPGRDGQPARSNPLLWDRETESWWQQLTGEAVVGALAGRRLGTVPEQTLTWSAFARRSPRADVLAPPRRSAADYGRNPYLGYDKPSSPPHLFAGPRADLLPAAGYPQPRLERRGGEPERIALGQAAKALPAQPARDRPARDVPARAGLAVDE